MELIPPKKIVIITSGQPSLNPRMVKEADALCNAGHNVTVLYAYWNDWATKFDKELLSSKKWKAICIGGDAKEKKSTYLLSRIINKAARFVNRITHGKYLAESAIARSSYFLTKAARRHPADLYIGHNLGALPATVKAAKRNNKPCGFDAEDFHRNEMSNDSNDDDVVLKTIIESRYILQVDYLTASSPLIADAYKQLFPDISPIVTRNVFERNADVKNINIVNDASIKLFWFSQTIGTNRGLQDVIQALELLHDQPFELHLLGNCSEETKSELTKSSKVNFRFHPPIHPEKLISFSSHFDIGLALEPGFSNNNNFALSNKIFTYLQAGLAIIVSDTAAQKQFLEEYPGVGKIYQKGNAQSLADILLYYHQHCEQLVETRKASLLLADKELNWETEQRIFLDVVEKTLSSF